MLCHLDHLTITAPKLIDGKTWVEQRLGAPMSTGGEHPRMGTHNMLMRVHDRIFLEVIAINPKAPSPARPRWFGLDALPQDASPGLRNWVARTQDLHTCIKRSPEHLGTIEPMQRNELHWLITIPHNGHPGLDGLAPSLIDWQTSPHPCTRLPDTGIRLHRFRLMHPNPQRVQTMLDALQLQSPVAIEVSGCKSDQTPHLIAEFETPHGIRTLS